MDWITPILSSAAIVTLLELVKWRMGINAERNRSKEKREESLEDEYRGDLKGRVARLEEENDAWKEKYYQLEANYKILEVKYQTEKTIRERMEWELKDIKTRLDAESKDNK